jgi:hypothetical protein
MGKFTLIGTACTQCDNSRVVYWQLLHARLGEQHASLGGNGSAAGRSGNPLPQ